MAAVRISRGQISTATPARISDLKIVASFNWEASELHKFFSPGFAPLLQENRQLLKLEKDTEEDMLDQTFLRNGKYPTEVLFRAVEVCDPQFSWRDVRVITERNVLRTFVDFVRGTNSTFLFYVDRVGNHFVFTRSYKPDGLDYRGYGHTFERVNTRMDRTSGCNAKDFCCITSYQLNDLKLLVKSEVDAVQLKRGMRLGDSAAQTQDLEWNVREGSALQHAKVGKPISKENYDIFEMKTLGRYRSTNIPWETYYYQMILGGVDCMIMAVHYQGTIQNRRHYSNQQIRQMLPENPEVNLGKLNLLLKTVMSRIIEMEPSGGHTVVQLECLPETAEISLRRIDPTCSKIPQWVVNKLQSE